MLWILVMAHLLGDYPLQTNRMVEMKQRWEGLILHVIIHFIIMLILLWPASATLWPYFLLLTGAHFAIDVLKRVLSQSRPRWISRTYLADQGLHLLSIWFISTWIERTVPFTAPLLPTTVTIYLIGYLLVTYVWSISERTMTHTNPSYRAEIETLFWPRISLRAGLLTLFLLGANLISGDTAVVAVSMFYLSSRFGRRILLTDMWVTLTVALFVLGTIKQ